MKILTFTLNMLKGVVICHQNQEGNHNKTTYKLSTATPVTSFIDTFFCSIIWAISPVRKDRTFYFNTKQNAHAVPLLELATTTSVHAYSHILQFLLQSLPSHYWEAWHSQPWRTGPLACSKLCILLALLLGKVWKMFLHCRGKRKIQSLDIKSKNKSCITKPLVERNE